MKTAKRAGENNGLHKTRLELAVNTHRQDHRADRERRRGGQDNGGHEGDQRPRQLPERTRTASYTNLTLPTIYLFENYGVDTSVKNKQ